MSVALASVAAMMIDCGDCAVRGAACADCVVTFLTVGVRDRGDSAVPLASSPGPSRASAVDLDDAEQAAIDVLASSGLVPPLRLAPRRVRAV